MPPIRNSDGGVPHLGKFLLWLLSLAALLAGIILIAAGVFAPTSSDYGQEALRMLGLSSIGGGVCAIFFAVAVNPLLARVIAPLRSTALRATVIVLSLALGTVAAGGIFMFGTSAIADIQNERYVQQSVPIEHIADVMWNGRDTIERSFFQHDPLATVDPPNPDAPLQLCGFFGFVGDDMLERMLESNPDFGGNLPAYRANMREVEELLLRHPADNAPQLIMLSEALRYCNAGGAPDLPRSASLLRQAADAGSATAAALLGQRYLRGVGVEPDANTAVVLFERAATSNDPLGQLFLANAYEHGLGGLTADPSRALQLYQAAANQEQVTALERLANAYATGALGEQSQEQSADARQRLCALIDCPTTGGASGLGP